MDNPSPSMLKSALIGGSAGALGGFPILGACCCLWMPAAGFLAAYLYSRECKQAGAAFGPGNGAMLGLITAPFYALASSLVGGLFQALMGPPDLDAIRQALEQGNAPEETIEMAMGFFDKMQGFTGFIFGFLVVLVLAAALSAIGGLIGGLSFKNDPAPAAPGGEPPASAG